MCISKKNQEKCKKINRSDLGRAVHGVLTHAKIERRLICGLLPAISYLEKNPDDVLLCFLSQSRPGDAAKHMQTVLLQAFCYENYIPVIQVDKLGDFSGNKTMNECLCAIITKDENLPMDDDDQIPMSPSEQFLTDFYECTLEEFPRPVIELPI